MRCRQFGRASAQALNQSVHLGLGRDSRTLNDRDPPKFLAADLDAHLGLNAHLGNGVVFPSLRSLSDGHFDRHFDLLEVLPVADRNLKFVSGCFVE